GSTARRVPDRSPAPSTWRWAQPCTASRLQERVRSAEEGGRLAPEQLALAQPAHVLVRRDLERPRQPLPHVRPVPIRVLLEEGPLELRVLRPRDRAEHLVEARP